MSERVDAPLHTTHYASAAPPAPLRKVARLSENRRPPTRDATGHPNDRGQDCDLIGAHVNGATDMTVGVYRRAPNEYHPRHFHARGTEFYSVLEGSCPITVDDEEVEATSGTAVYLPEGTVHAVRTRDHESVAILYGFDEGIAENNSVTWLE